MVSSDHWFCRLRVSQVSTAVHGPMSGGGWPSGKGNRRRAERLLAMPDKRNPRSSAAHQLILRHL